MWLAVNIGYRPLFYIQLCSELSPPSSSRCTACSILFIFPCFFGSHFLVLFCRPIPLWLCVGVSKPSSLFFFSYLVQHRILLSFSPQLLLSGDVRLRHIHNASQTFVNEHLHSVYGFLYDCPVLRCVQYNKTAFTLDLTLLVLLTIQ